MSYCVPSISLIQHRTDQKRSGWYKLASEHDVPGSPSLTSTNRCILLTLLLATILSRVLTRHDTYLCRHETDSMKPYIITAQEKICAITEALVAYDKCDVHFGLVAYRDHSPVCSTFLTKKSEFTYLQECVRPFINSGYSTRASTVHVSSSRSVESAFLILG